MRDVWFVLLETGVQVYAMGIFDEARRTSAELMGPDLLGAITSITGAETFPIRDLKKIGNAIDDLALDLRNQYVIGTVQAILPAKGRWHKVSVSVKPPEGSSRLRVYAKAGYCAPSN